MEWPLSASVGGAQAAQGAADDGLRLLLIPKDTAATPQRAFSTPVRWAVASPESAPPFSAACFTMARQLRKDLRVPVGAINSNWGGSADPGLAQSRSRPHALRRRADGAAQGLREGPARRGDRVRPHVGKMVARGDRRARTVEESRRAGMAAGPVDQRVDRMGRYPAGQGSDRQRVVPPYADAHCRAGGRRRHAGDRRDRRHGHDLDQRADRRQYLRLEQGARIRDSARLPQSRRQRDRVRG